MTEKEAEDKLYEFLVSVPFDKWVDKIPEFYLHGLWLVVGPKGIMIRIRIGDKTETIRVHESDRWYSLYKSIKEYFYDKKAKEAREKRISGIEKYIKETKDYIERK